MSTESQPTIDLLESIISNIGSTGSVAFHQDGHDYYLDAKRCLEIKTQYKAAYALLQQLEDEYRKPLQTVFTKMQSDKRMALPPLAKVTPTLAKTKNINAKRPTNSLPTRSQAGLVAAGGPGTNKTVTTRNVTKVITDQARKNVGNANRKLNCNQEKKPVVSGKSAQSRIAVERAPRSQTGGSAKKANVGVSAPKKKPLNVQMKHPTGQDGENIEAQVSLSPIPCINKRDDINTRLNLTFTTITNATVIAAADTSDAITKDTSPTGYMTCKETLTP